MVVKDVNLAGLLCKTIRISTYFWPIHWVYCHCRNAIVLHMATVFLLCTV